MYEQLKYYILCRENRQFKSFRRKSGWCMSIFTMLWNDKSSDDDDDGDNDEEDDDEDDSDHDYDKDVVNDYHDLLL